MAVIDLYCLYLYYRLVYYILFPLWCRTFLFKCWIGGNVMINKPTAQNHEKIKKTRQLKKKKKAFLCPFSTKVPLQHKASNPLIRPTWLSWHLKSSTSLNPHQITVCFKLYVWVCTVAATAKLDFCVLSTFSNFVDRFLLLQLQWNQKLIRSLERCDGKPWSFWGQKYPLASKK